LVVELAMAPLANAAAARSATINPRKSFMMTLL
jgi:hypothetical protein